MNNFVSGNIFSNGLPNNYNGQMNNYQTSFNNHPSVNINGYDPKANFTNNNFVNKGDIMYNNLNGILLNEEIREYSVMIDSKDRNYQTYPDPFNYEVKFNPLPKTVENINGKKIVYEESMPFINDNFVNVRYIKLESVILPFYTQVRLVKEDDDGDIIESVKVNTVKPLTDNLYIILSLGEYTDTNYRSTNDVLSESFAIIYFDKKISNTHYLGTTSNGIKIFPQDQLAKINKLKISFMDPYGKPLRCDHIDKRIKSGMECTCNDPEGDDDTDCFKHNLFHPLNPIYQHHIHFKVGVVEPRLNKKIFS
ncbi:hypothetical protein QLL95_gp0900 [Cotonvirus japonicus]|uniref:Uncharacterized protein n=1 Tax=Cotonvirus japonicus TaxID=2811091 RepID=A0ABM7NSU3_9VIRU|nr:hypothetical protein QLL95_gp0900 [Cotonvirus japonicus]BCS83223.1 hypothetical protein [Cotonvirus japonicus]